MMIILILLGLLIFPASGHAQVTAPAVIQMSFVEYPKQCPNNPTSKPWGGKVIAESPNPWKTTNDGSTSTNVYSIHHMYVSPLVGQPLALPNVTFEDTIISGGVPGDRGAAVTGPVTYRRTWTILPTPNILANGNFHCPLFGRGPGSFMEFHAVDTAGQEILLRTNECAFGAGGTDTRVVVCSYP